MARTGDAAGSADLIRKTLATLSTNDGSLLSRTLEAAAAQVVSTPP